MRVNQPPSAMGVRLISSILSVDHLLHVRSPEQVHRDRAVGRLTARARRGGLRRGRGGASGLGPLALGGCDCRDRLLFILPLRSGLGVRDAVKLLVHLLEPGPGGFVNIALSRLGKSQVSYQGRNSL